MNEQLPEHEMELLIADAVRYRFLRDIAPAITKECIANKDYDWALHVGFDFIAYTRQDGTIDAVYGQDLDDAIDAELFNAISKETP